MGEQRPQTVRLHPNDEAQIRRFASFLRQAGPAPGTASFDRSRFRAALAEHYPEDIAACSLGRGTGNPCPHCESTDGVHRLRDLAVEWCEDCKHWIDPPDRTPRGQTDE